MLTKRQAEVLDYICVFMAEKRYCPSYEEIMDGCDISSKSGVHRLVSSLEERGFIEKIPGKSRAINVKRRNLEQQENVL